MARPSLFMIVCGLACSTAFLSFVASKVHPLHRRLEIINDSGEQLAVDWVNPRDGKPQPFRSMDDVKDAMALDSYVNHTFVFRSREAQPSACSTDEDAGCKVIGSFTVSENKTTQMIVIKEGLELVQAEEEIAKPHNQVATDLIFKCRIMSDTALDRGSPANKVLKELYQCLERETAAALEANSEELGFQSEMRLKLSGLAENHTCSDPNMETTKPKEVRNWTHDGVTRRVGVLHDRPSSQIHVLHDFISREECDAVEAAAKSSLHRGTVADGKGGSRLSEHRKAWQAGISVDWAKEEAGDPIAAVVRRLFDYANHVTGRNMMSVEGQEDLMSIQYFGNGPDDPTPDQYTPHCDGDCDGSPHKKGGRVATIVMYCNIPEMGGGTNFQNSNVFVKPEVGAAAFFSYMDPQTGDHESGFTSHSGCPVLLGTKRIAVQWMRVGVDADNPWDSFDTNTISRKLKEEIVGDDGDVDEEEEADLSDDELFAEDDFDDEDYDDEDDDDEDFDDEEDEDWEEDEAEWNDDYWNDDEDEAKAAS